MHQNQFPGEDQLLDVMLLVKQSNWRRMHESCNPSEVD